MIKGGFAGKLLRIDLSAGTWGVEDIDPEVLKTFVGGAALAAKILYDELPGGVDALGPANKLVYTVGPLTGTRTPSASRLCVGTKSPLTGALAIALSGGYFPVELKWAGYDALVIEGRAEKPVWIFVKDGQVEIRGAEKYWGMDTQDTQILPEGRSEGPERAHLLHRAGRREPIPCRGNRERGTGRRPQGRGRRDGQQEPEGHRRARQRRCNRG